jgi:hypothetical protein
VTVYQVVCAETADDLETSVKMLMAGGWVPHGGVSVSGWFETWENRDGWMETNRETRFAQAMTRPDFARAINERGPQR